MNNGIGKAVRHYREKAGISQREFADLLGYKNHTSITRIEGGSNDVPLSVVEKMAEILHVTPADFFFFSNDDFTEYLPYLAQASEETLRTIRYMLHMPEKKTESSSEFIKITG